MDIHSIWWASTRSEPCKSSLTEGTTVPDGPVSLYLGIGTFFLILLSLSNGPSLMTNTVNYVLSNKRKFKSNLLFDVQLKTKNQIYVGLRRERALYWGA